MIVLRLVVGPRFHVRVPSLTLCNVTPAPPHAAETTRCEPAVIALFVATVCVVAVVLSLFVVTDDKTGVPIATI